MSAEQRYYDFSGFRLDADEGILHRPDGEIVTLTPKLLQLLLLFLESDGRVLAREDLIARLWPDSVVEPTSLKQLVYSLRRVLGDSEGTDEMIKTLPRRGYRFAAAGDTRPKETEYSVTTVTIEEEEEIEYDDAAANGRHDQQETVKALLPGVRPPGIARPLLAVLLPLGVILLGLLGWAIWLRTPAPALTTENISLQRLTHTDNLYWAIISPNGQFVAYVALHQDGTQSMELLDVTTRTERTLVARANVSFYGGSFTPDSSQLYYDTWDHSDLSGLCVLYQIPLLGDKPRKVLDSVAGPISFSPDGKRFVFSRRELSGQTVLVLANSADGSDQQVLATGQPDDDFIAPNWAPDGHAVAFVHTVKTIDGTSWALSEVLMNGERRMIAGPSKQRYWGAIWLGDGNTMLLSASAPDSKIGQLFTVSYPKGEIKRLTNDLNYYTGLSATADGRKIIVTQGQRSNDIWVAPVGSDKPTKIAGGSFVIDSITWSPNDKIIYNVSENGQHKLTSIAPDGSERANVLPVGVQGLFPRISPDGKRMVFISNRSGSWQIWISAVDGSDMRQLTSDPEIVASPDFVLDGSSIVFMRWVDDKAILTMMDQNGADRRDVSPYYVSDWAVSHDRRKIAYAFYDLENKKNRTAVKSIGSDTPGAVLDLLPRDLLLFSPSDDHLLTKRYEPEADPISTIWSFPISGGPPTVFYRNPPDNIYAADFSGDKGRLAVVQGRVVSNLVLMSMAK